MKAAVLGAGGFIGGHLVQHLLLEGYEVNAVDIKDVHKWYQAFEEAKNYRLDLSTLRTCKLSILDCDVVFNLAANMGGMGFIASHRVECMETAAVTLNTLRAAYEEQVDRFFYASSACVYPDYLQTETQVSLAEVDAWPADPEPGYGLEKLYGEELAKFWRLEQGLNTRVARFHNIFGPYGTYDGGREKAPAAICRKVAQCVLTGDDAIEIWGDGEQTRSFLYVDECIDGIMKLTFSDIVDPINLGSDELVSINRLVEMVEEIAGIPRLHRVYNLDAPQGVRGRCSDNALIEEKLGWRPSAALYDGLEKTYRWIYDQISVRTK